MTSHFKRYISFYGSHLILLLRALNKELIILGFFISVVGLFIGFCVPYTITQEIPMIDPYTGRHYTERYTITVYGHPSGFFLNGIGFLIILIGLFYKPTEKTLPKPKVCGTCVWFGKPLCPRGEKIYSADPCESYTPS